MAADRTDPFSLFYQQILELLFPEGPLQDQAAEHGILPEAISQVRFRRGTRAFSHQRRVFHFVHLKPAGSFHFGILAQQFLLAAQVDLMLAILDHLYQISVRHIVPQAAFLPLGTEDGQSLTNRLGSKATGEPFPDPPFGIQIGNPEEVEPRIQKAPTYRFGRQEVEPLFLCVIRMQLFYELPVFPGSGQVSRRTLSLLLPLNSKRPAWLSPAV